MIDRLIEILGEEAAVFESFLQLLEKQQHALVTNDVDELNHITELQQEKLAESRQLNNQREQVIDKIKEANLIEGDLTVTRLIDMVDHHQADKLHTLRKSLRGLNNRILRTRNQNAMLLNKSREYIHKTMEMLSRIGKPAPGYNATGTEQGANVNIALDRRA